MSLVPLAFTLLTQAHALLLYHYLSPKGQLLGLQKITGSRSENEVLSHQCCVCLRKRALWVFSIVFPIWHPQSKQVMNVLSQEPHSCPSPELCTMILTAPWPSPPRQPTNSRHLACASQIHAPICLPPSAHTLAILLALVGPVSTKCPSNSLLACSPSSTLVLLVLQFYQLYLLNTYFLCLQVPVVFYMTTVTAPTLIFPSLSSLPISSSTTTIQHSFPVKYPSWYLYDFWTRS